VKESLRTNFLISLLLFLSLGTWSVSSPIGSGVDTDFHLGSIWCARGESKGLCEAIDTAAWPSANVTAIVPFMFQMCDERNIYFWPECEVLVDNPNTQETRIAPSHQRSLYYWTTHIFASTNVNRSVIFIRLFNSLIASLVLFASLVLSSDRLRKAVVISWTLTLIPNGIQFLSGVNPRSWAVLGIMSSWVFLHAFLTEETEHQQRRLWQIGCYLASIGLTASARFDALLIVLFISTVVLSAHFIDFNKLSFRRAARIGGVLTAAVFALKMVPRLDGVLSIGVPEPFSAPQYFIFQLEHIPEFIADWWGYRIGQQGNGPGIVGLMGVILFSIYMYASLRRASRKQIFVSSAVSIFIFLVLFRATTAVLGIVPLSGVYTFGMSAPLIGLTLVFSNIGDKEFFQNGLIKFTLITVSFIHTLTFYHWIEFFTQRGVNTGFFYKFSLNGTWWWDTWISPNFVFLVGAVLFPIFLTYSWRSTIQEFPE
jgi:hypothetical protein